MKKKIGFKLLSAVLPATLLPTAVLTGCAPLHMHDYSSPYHYDETSHWQVCNDCHEEFNKGEHVFNELTNKCIICGYEDPVAVVDQQGVMTGLTAHSKSTYTVNIPTNVSYVGAGAFAGSKAVTVKLPRELKGYYKGAFDGSNVKNIVTEEEEVEWVDMGDRYEKKDVLESYQAKVGDKYYEDLSQAFEDIVSDDQTITILKDDLTIDKPIYVSHIVYLEPYHAGAKLHCNFNIYASGIVYIPSTLTYEGNTKLCLLNYKEQTAELNKNNNIFVDCYNSGSLVFTNRNTRPDNVNVAYVRNFQTDIEDGYEAIGSPQIANSVLVIPVNHYAFGTFLFSKDFKEIKGLTQYGKTVTSLTVTNVIKGIEASIGVQAFVLHARIKIPIAIIDDTTYNLYYSKGSFTNLNIGNGIIEIKTGAFSSYVDGNISATLKKILPILFSHILTLNIGDDVKVIGQKAFYQNISLKSVTGGKNIISIGESAFEQNLSLTSADFSQSFFLSEIKSKAFSSCTVLTQVVLPYQGWTVKKGSDTREYFPSDLTPDVVALYMTDLYNEWEWQRKFYVDITFCYTQTLDVDDYGRYTKIAYTNSWKEIQDNCPPGGKAYILKDSSCAEIKPENDTISKSITIIADPEKEGRVAIGSQYGVLKIASGAYLQLENIEPSRRYTSDPYVVTLLTNKSEQTNGTFYKTAAFAIRDNGFIDPSNLIIKYEIDDHTKYNGLTCPILVDDQKYIGAGLYNFTRPTNEPKILDIEGVNDFTYANVNDITINQQIDDANFPIDEIRFKAPPGKQNSIVRTIRFDKKFTEIDVKLDLLLGLERVILPEGNSLKYIRDNAFVGCINLNIFDLAGNVTNWYLGTKQEHTESIDEAILKDKYKTADYITDGKTGGGKAWVRSY